MKKLFKLILITVTLCNGISYSQTKIERLFSRESYFDVITNLKEKEKELPLNYNEIEYLALSYYYNNDYSNAYIYFNKLINLKELTTQNKFYYAHCLKSIGSEDESNIYLKKYYTESNKDMDKYFEDLDAVKRLGNRYIIKNLSKINSEYSDIISSSSDGFIYFSSSRPNKAEADKYRWNNQPYLDNFIMKKDSSIHSFNELNTDYHDGDISINKINDDIYFTSSKPDSKVFLKKDQVITTKIYKATFDNTNLKSLELLPFNSNDFSCKNPFVDYKNNRLYFSSNKPGGIGGFDIYYVDIQNPIIMHNLGTDTNSISDEDFFFIDENKNMYFSSNGFVGFGGKDVYTRIYEPETQTYKRVMNVGLPINTNYDDFSFIVTKDKNGLFSSNRKNYESKGDDDIYTFLETIPLDLDKILQSVSGIVTDSVTNATIKNANIIYTDENSNEFKTVSDLNGNYKIENLLGNKKYNVNTQAERYNSKNEVFLTTSVKYDNLIKNIKLEPAECLQLYTGIITDKKTTNKLSGVKVSFYDSSNNLISSVKTDNNGFYEIYAPCGKTLLYKADLNDVENPPYYAEYREYIETGKDWGKKNDKNVELIPVDSRGLISDKFGNIMIPTKPIYFAYNSAVVEKESEIELDKVVSLMKEHSNWKLIVESHSDMRGNDDYNLILSNKRAESTKKYMVSKGLESLRISCKGYGESKPLLDCYSKECSEEEHGINRRSDFIIK